MQDYPYADTVLLYQHTTSDRFYCQYPACRKDYNSREAALRHGNTHFKALGLCAQSWRVITHTRLRPVSSDEYKEYRLEYTRQWWQRRRQWEREARAEGQRQAEAAGTSDTRLFPYGLSASRGQGRGCDHQVVMAARGGGCNRLAVTGWVTGEDMVASIRFALAWARLHRGMIAKLFFGGGEASAGPATRADDDATRLLALDVYRRDLDFFVTVGGANARKHGASIGLAAACAFVRLMTNVGVESCVAMTGELSLRGAVNKIGGLEDKLRFAHSSPHISVVVIPRDNYKEAVELVRKHDLSSIQLVPVGHMLEVIHHIFLRSVTQGVPAAVSQPSQPWRGTRKVVMTSMAVHLLKTGEVGFPVIEATMLPGTGQVWDSGSFGGGEGPPTGTEQVIHACACARELINTLRKHPGRRLMRDPFKATRDLHLYLGRGGHNVMSGFAVTCAILALALHRPIAADIAISSGVCVTGLVWSPADVSEAHVLSLARGGCSRLLASPTTCAEVNEHRTRILARARGSGRDLLSDELRVEALEVVEIRTVVDLDRLCAALWPDVPTPAAGS